MAAKKFVTVEKGLGPEGRVGVVRFDRGDALNALSPEAMRQLRAAAQSFEDDTATSVVVLTGNSKVFSAGFDLKDKEGRARGKLGLGERRAALKAGPRLCRAWFEMEQVTIAAIEGPCVGGGVALAVSLDFRFCAAGAHFRIPEVALGMNMSWGSLPRLLALMGPARTKQAVILANDRIEPAEAERWGLVEKVVDDGQSLSAAMAFAERIAALPPLPVTMTKTSINRLAGALDELAAHMDTDQFALASLSADHAEGVAAFLQRRKPRFRGH
jgi:enoyl-CoA hydratase/carnithine racemase